MMSNVIHASSEDNQHHPVDALVSIVLPVAGDGAALARTVAAVRAQTQQDWALLLVASDATQAQAQACAALDGRIRVLVQPSNGRAAALRAGLQHARGTFTVFLDTEHVWTPDFLAMGTDFLQSYPLEDLVCLDACTPDGAPTLAVRPGVFREPRLAFAGRVWQQGELARHLRWGAYTHLAVMLVRTELAERLTDALQQDSEALEYRLQGVLASWCAVNRLVAPGATHWPQVDTEAQARQRALDTLAVFDEIHGRQWETDPEVARLRRAQWLRTATRVTWRLRVARALAWLVRPGFDKALSIDLVDPQAVRPRCHASAE
jgi:Glycosyl transferase family 2